MENGLESRFSLKVADDGKKLIRDDKPISRMAEHIGTLPVVMVSPGDGALVSESGEERRRLSNAILSQMDAEYLAAVQSYTKLLAQRNKLLKDLQPDFALMDVIDERMAVPAAYIFDARKRLAADLRPVVAQYYSLISGGGESVSLEYRSDLAGSSLQDVFASHRDRDLALRYTSTGVQRDDFVFTMDGHPIRRGGSQGQQKSFLVALKFAQYEIMKRAYGFAPMLLLDDVFDKLDMGRISNLIGMVAGSDFGQIFITDTDKKRLASVVDRITEDRAYFDTASGTFTRVE
jgi:DNA replication and repair protein RecF